MKGYSKMSKQYTPETKPPSDGDRAISIVFTMLCGVAFVLIIVCYLIALGN